MIESHSLLAFIVFVALWIALFALFLWRASKTNHSLKTYLQEAFRDAHDIFHPALSRLWCILRRLWAFFGPRLTNRALWMALAADLSAYSGGETVWKFMADHPITLIGLIVLNLLTPLTPVGAPQRIDPPRPAMGPGALAGQA